MSNSQTDEAPLEEDALGKMLSLHLDSKISAEQFSQLKDSLEANESARDFYIEFIAVHSQLEQIHKAPFSNKEYLNELLQVPEAPTKRPYLLMMGLPAALLVAICIWIGSQLPDKPAEIPVDYQVTVSDTYQAFTKHDGLLNIGQKLKSNTPYRLESGQVELLFLTGVKVLISAPAHFEVIGENEIDLSAGILIAKVTTAKGKGFTVRTPGGPVLDLGTLFGVEIESSGTSNVQVFKGEVELANSRGAKKILSEGKILRGKAGQDQWQPAKRLSRKFYSVIQKNKQALTPNIVLVPDAENNMFGADEHIGKSYLLYSPASLRDQIVNFEKKDQRLNISTNFAVVYFNETSRSWQFLVQETLMPFVPDATDLLLATIESTATNNDSIKKTITYFSGTRGTIHGISYGFQSGDIQVLPDHFLGQANQGDFSLVGTFFIRNPD